MHSKENSGRASFYFIIAVVKKKIKKFCLHVNFRQRNTSPKEKVNLRKKKKNKRETKIICNHENSFGQHL